MKKEKKNLSVKLFEACLSVHFIFWYTVSFVMFFAIFYFFDHRTSKPTFPVEKLAIACAIISIMMATLFTLMRWQMGKSQKFYDGLRELEKEVKESTTVDELIDVRAKIVKYGKEKSTATVMWSACKKVIIVIDTRLEYEFNR